MLDKGSLIRYNVKVSKISPFFDIWPHGQAVKTPPFHGGIRGSIPLEATIEKKLRFCLASLVSEALRRGRLFFLLLAPDANVFVKNIWRDFSYKV